MDITEAKQRRKTNEASLRDLCNHIKYTNIHIIRVLEGKDRKKEAENIFEDIIAENFPNIGKETDVQGSTEPQT